LTADTAQAARPDAGAQPDAVRCKELSYSFGTHTAVDHVTLEIRPAASSSPSSAAASVMRKAERQL
jgi:hypothetical protein